MNLILASNSPRRKELLTGLELPFEVRTLPDVDESFPSSLQEGDIPLYISHAKAGAYRALMGEEELLKSRGVRITVLDSAECKNMMKKFIEIAPEAWNEDIGV